MRRAAPALAMILALAMLTGCGGAEERPGGTREGGGISVADAAAFAGFRLPSAAEPVAAYEERGIDRLVAFAVRIPPDALAKLLSDAHFSEELRAGERVTLRPVPGARLDGGSSFAAAQDRRELGGTMVTRDVMVVTHDPGPTLVHVWAFTT
jgi:hypothetical protein